jgi:hypothetical protein
VRAEVTPAYPKPRVRVEVFKSSTSWLSNSRTRVHSCRSDKMAEQVTDIHSATAIMDLILPLPLSHPSISNLLALQPLAHPSSISHSVIVKFLNRVNTAVLGREGEREAKNASMIALKLVEDDQEGWVLSEYGKGWTNVCLTELAVCPLFCLSE